MLNPNTVNWQLDGLLKSKKNTGFTLVELVIVVLMVSIIAAIAMPNFIGSIARAQVNQGVDRLRGLLQMTQREAIKKSTNCTIELPASKTKNPILTSTCTIEGDRTLKNIHLAYNNTGDVVIDFRGGANRLRTFVLYSEASQQRRCVVISNNIGMIRAGIYTDDNMSAVKAAHCIKAES